jgi:hypothetical protein
MNYGASLTFTITPSTGYHVADVLVDGASVGAVTSFTLTNVTAAHTIAASFAVDTFTITATVGANGSISPSGPVSVNYGSNQAFTITPSTGYHVADVLVDGSSVGTVTSYTFTNVTAAHSIVASFAINTYTVTAAVAGDLAGDSVSPPSQVVSHGSAATFTVTIHRGYTLEVSEGTLVGNVWTIPNITSSRTVTVTFHKIYDILRSMVNGCVTKQGIINSLMAKLDNAEAAEKRGDLNAKAGIIGAFINEVEAQTGKAIPAACAAELIRLAKLL